MTHGSVNDMEIEVEEEVDTGEYKSGAGTGNQQKQNSDQDVNKQKYENVQRIFWDKEKLAEAGIEQISGEKYTTEIYDKNSETSVEPWLLVFTKDLTSENPYD